MVQLKNHIDFDSPLSIVSSIFIVGLIGVALYYLIHGLNYLMHQVGPIF